MKNFLWILALGLLWCNVSYGEAATKIMIKCERGNEMPMSIVLYDRQKKVIDEGNEIHENDIVEYTSLNVRWKLVANHHLDRITGYLTVISKEYGVKVYSCKKVAKTAFWNKIKKNK